MQGASAFSIAMIMFAVLPLTQAVNQISSDLTINVIALKSRVEASGIGATTWLIMIMQLTGYAHLIKRRFLFALSVIPLVMLFLNWTENPLFRSGYFLDSASILHWSTGPLFWFGLAYLNIVLLIPLFLIWRSYNHVSHLSLQQSLALSIAVVLPILFNVLIQLKIFIIDGINFPFAAGPFMGLLVVWAVFQYHLFDLVPVARGLLIESMSDGVLVLDTQNRIMDANPAMQEMLGLVRHEILGENADAILAPWPELVNRFRNVHDTTTEIFIDEKHPLYLDLRISPLSDQRGQEAGRLVVVRDITRRKHAEMEIEKSEKRFHLLFDTAMEGIVFTKPDGTVHSANPAALTLFGYTETEIHGLSREKLVDFSDPLLKASFEERNRVGFAKGEFTAIRKDGSTLPVEMNSILFQQDDILASTFIRDITDRKLAEIEREKLVAELKNKNAELEKFTHTVSHDLKAPLFTIQGFMGYLERDILANKPEKVQEDIDRITSAIDKMQRLLNELLELSRVGKVMNAPQQIALETIANDAVNLVTGRIAARKVTVNIQPDLPAVYCDRVRITQVLQNLIDNAVKFMGEQPNPLISIGQRIEYQKPIFFVHDNGMGIAPEHQDRIFGLFDKLDTKVEGTGVGLALVKRIIEMHGGKLWVESEGQGKGSTFCFTIPDERDG